MMLRIGSKWLAGERISGLASLTGQPAHRRTKKGFTLVEIMVATAVLAVGIVLIYQSFFSSLGAFNYYAKYILAQPWASQKIWQVQDELSHYGRMADNNAASGIFTNKNSDFNWELSVSALEETKNFSLYRINLQVHLPQGRKTMRILREAYALYRKKE